MGLLGRSLPFDRDRILQEAARAKARRKQKRAVSLYRRVLALEPANAELHAKIAPLLAATGQSFDAWISFRTAARNFVRQGEIERALATFSEATQWLPREVEAWAELADLRRQQGEGREAKQTLLEGFRYFTTGWLRPCAIYLLRRAREIDPWDLDTVIELALLLVQTRQREEATALLEALAMRAEGHDLVRVRAAQLRVAPSLFHAWLWYSALRARRAALPDPEPDEEPEEFAPLADVVELRALPRDRS
jgi:thioredoxin-like negative regulator of GroEL